MVVRLKQAKALSISVIYDIAYQYIEIFSNIQDANRDLKAKDQDGTNNS